MCVESFTDGGENHIINEIQKTTHLLLYQDKTKDKITLFVK